MTKNEVIEKISNEKMVEEIVHNIAQTNNNNTRDLVQDVYLILLETDEDKIIKLYVNKQMKFYITRIVMNQYNSTLSPYYMKYRKHSFLSYDIDTYLQELEDKYTRDEED